MGSEVFAGCGLQLEEVPGGQIAVAGVDYGSPAFKGELETKTKTIRFSDLLFEWSGGKLLYMYHCTCNVYFFIRCVLFLSSELFRHYQLKMTASNFKLQRWQDYLWIEIVKLEIEVRYLSHFYNCICDVKVVHMTHIFWWGWFRSKPCFDKRW